MRKHNFETSNIFCTKKKHSKHVRVLAVCNTQENIFLYFCRNANITIRRKHQKWKIARHHTYYKNYKKLETIRKKNPSKPNQLKIL